MTEIPTKELAAIEKEISPMVSKAQSYEITNVQQVDEASVFLRELQQTEKRIEDKRTEITKPMNQSLKAINDLFKKVSAPIIQARGLLTNRILTWRREEADRIEKEEARRRKIQDAHAEMGHEVNAPVMIQRTETTIGNTRVSKVWKWKLEDFGKLPDDFKGIDGVKINAVIRGGIREIPGLKIYEEEALSVIGR